MQHRIIFAAITGLVCLVIVAGQVFSQQPTPAHGRRVDRINHPGGCADRHTRCAGGAGSRRSARHTGRSSHHPGRRRPSPLKAFGEELFSNATYAADQPDAAVPDDYLLNSGDALSVLCWSGANEYERNTYTITPDGDIYLKLLGAVPLAQEDPRPGA